MGDKLRNAPVFYTLLQFKFNTITQMSEYVPRLQETLRRHGYPDFRQENKISINIRRPEDPQPEIQDTKFRRWLFTNSKSTEGYILLPDALVFHTTRYESFESFSRKALEGLSLVHKEIDLAYIDRIGLRYLDSISPRAEEGIEDYLAPSLLGAIGLFGEDISLNHAFSETSLNIDGGTLVSRSVITDGGLAIPPDLSPIILNIDEKFSSLSGRNAVLDIDYFISERFEVSQSDMMRQLVSSHNIVKDAFRGSVSRHALKSWG